MSDQNQVSPNTGPGRPGDNNLRSWFWYVSAGASALFAGIGLLYLTYHLAHPLALLLLGVTLASAISPSIRAVDRRLPRIVAIVLVYFVLVVFITGIVAAISPVIGIQAQDFAQRVPQLVAAAGEWLEKNSPVNLTLLVDTLTSQFGVLGSALVSLPISIFSSLLDIILVFFISLYWLLIAPAMSKFVLSLFPAHSHDRLRKLACKMEQAMGGYLRASAINGIVVGSLVYIGLLIIGVNFPAVLGLISAVLEIIPTLGPALAGFIIVLVALLQSPKLALISLIFIIVLQQVENHILVPNIMRTQTEISPLLVILALLSGAALGGLLGALVSIPLVAALNVILKDLVAPRIRERTGAAQEGG